jgi:hypothetical protein
MFLRFVIKNDVLAQTSAVNHSLSLPLFTPPALSISFACIHTPVPRSPVPSAITMSDTLFRERSCLTLGYIHPIWNEELRVPIHEADRALV